MPPKRDFWGKVAFPAAHEGCWEWQGSVSPSGYGRARVGNTNSYAHRVTYVLLRGPIPEGRELDHLCRNRACCNPDHLEPVTCRENVLRGYRARGKATVNHASTHCKSGHAFDVANTRDTFVAGQANPRRFCRACDRERKRQERAKAKH